MELLGYSSWGYTEEIPISYSRMKKALIMWTQFLNLNINISFGSLSQWKLLSISVARTQLSSLDFASPRGHLVKILNLSLAHIRVVFRMRNAPLPPIGSGIWTLGPWLGTVGEVWEGCAPRCGGLWEYSLAYSKFSLCFLFPVGDMSLSFLLQPPCQTLLVMSWWTYSSEIF